MTELIKHSAAQSTSLRFVYIRYYQGQRSADIHKTRRD